jgi:hypothetical protein
MAQSHAVEPSGPTIEVQGHLDTDPDIALGGILTIERADGRSVWRQRMAVSAKAGGHYTLRPVDACYGFILPGPSSCKT